MLRAVIAVDELTKRYSEGLRHRYRKTLAVDRLSFVVEPGSIVGFLGPNGAGKTTTLRVLLGLVRPTAGSATILGKRYVQLERPTTQVGAVLEASGFHPGRSARNHLRVIARATGIGNERVEEVLGLVDLKGAARRRVGAYSLGMRQRLAIAAALLGDPRVLVLDEPANGLDPEGMRWLRNLLRSLAERERAVLISSHVLSEVSQIADEAVIINHGRLIAQEPVEQLMRRSDGRVRVVSPQADALARHLLAVGMTVEPEAGALVVAGGTSAAIGEIAARNSLVLHELTPLASQLEDVFLELTAEAPS
jgi:ABC-2 type transport system ATP-binding protein